jgi:hypothetical protein
MNNLIKATGLDPDAPYSLGNKEYFYERKCNSGHENLTDDEIAFTGGYYDGYNWIVPVCKRCIAKQEDKRVMVYSHYTPFHLKEFNAL